MSTAVCCDDARERGLCFVPLLFFRERLRKGMRGKATNIKSFPDALFHPVYKAQNHTKLFRLFIKFAYCLVYKILPVYEN